MLPATSWEASSNISGSFYRENIEDYYVSPFDLGYGRILKFDHDFIGRPALEKIAKERHRTNVTLVWNEQDLQRVQSSLFEEELPNKLMRLPIAAYGYQHRDAVLGPDGQTIGYSAICAYSANERKMLSLAIVDGDVAKIGSEVKVVWGEPNGGSRKPQIERHSQTMLRATVAPAPYALSVQSMKRASFNELTHVS